MNQEQKTQLIVALASTFNYGLTWKLKASEALDRASPTQLAVIAHSDLADQRDMLEELIADRITHTTVTQRDETSVSMSEATTNILRQVMAAGGFISTVVSASRAPLRARPVRGTKPFDWNREQGEGSSANASRTVDYFNSIVPPPCNNHVWIDRFETESLLNCKVPGMNVVVLKGTADVAPCTSAAIKNEYEQSGRRLRIVVDVKQPGNTDGNLPQLAAVLLGACYYSPRFKPIGLLTDLVDVWRLMWYKEGAFAVYTCEDRAEAIGFLRAFLKKERLTADTTAIAQRKRPAGRDTNEEVVVDALLKRQRLPAELGPSDIANLSDLLDFADHLTEQDIFQLTHQPLMQRLREQARFVAASAFEGDGGEARRR